MRDILALPFKYGGDYNPEQWPIQIINDDITLMQECHFNLATLGVFSWAEWEKQEGKYDFSNLLKTMDQLHAAGVQVDLATGTASPPAWLARQYPESLPITATGAHIGFGSRQQYSPSSAIVKTKMLALVKALANTVKDHPALAIWHVGNEFGNHVWESFDTESAEAFRAWLKARYNCIENLNQAWCTAFWSQRYNNFEEINPPGLLPSFPNMAQIVDWRRFNNHQLLNLYKAEATVLHEITPNIPVTTNFMGAFWALDYWQWAKEMDVITDDSYPDPADPTSAAEVAFSGDIMRSLGNGQPFILMEQTTSSVQWRSSGNSHKRPGQYELWSLSRMGRGANGILQFQWRQSRGGAEAMHSAMVSHAGKSNPIWPSVCRLGDGLHRLSLAAQPNLPAPAKAQVAIVLDWENVWSLQAWIGQIDIDPFTAIRNWHQTFWEAGYLVDFVAPNAKNLSKYRVIVLPQILRISTADLDKYCEIAQQGTQIIVIGPSGVYDENLWARLGGYLGSLAQAAGVQIIDHAPTTGNNFHKLRESPDPTCDRITKAIQTPSINNYIEIEFDIAAFTSNEMSRFCDAVPYTTPVNNSDNNQFTPVSTRYPELSTTKHYIAGRWAEYIKVQAADVKVIAYFASNGATIDFAEILNVAAAPAITYREYGNGGLWYVATDLAAPGRNILSQQVTITAQIRPESEQIWTALHSLSSDANKNNINTTRCLPAGIEVIQRGNWVFLLNHGETDIALPTDYFDIYSGNSVNKVCKRSGIIIRAYT